MSENVPMDEVDKTKPEITWYGSLFGEKFDRNIWRGQISALIPVLRKRFGTDYDETFDMLRERRRAIENFFVRANPSAQVRCIDGRGEANTRPGSSDLGPQVPGGTPVMALCWRLANWRGERGKDIENDLGIFKILLEKNNLPFVPGAHEDEHNEHHEEKTGCGAIDRMREILIIMQQRALMLPYVQAIAGEYFDGELMGEICDRLGPINAQPYNDQYLMHNPVKGIHEFGNRLIHKMRIGGERRGRKAVEKLSGDHNEAFLIINTVSDETFERDGFAAESDGLVQAFNYDFWYAVNCAKGVFPDDEEAQRSMIMANAMYAVATAMILTDGSLEYAVRS